MTQIEPISSDRISSSLRGLGISLRVDGDGDSVANFVKGNLRVFKLLFMATGQDCDILKIHGFFCTDSLGLEDLTQLIGNCNQWNRGYLWPATMVTFHSNIAQLGADVNIPLPAGVSDAELSVFLDTTISAFWQCSEWLTQEVGSIHGDRHFSEQDRVDLEKLFGQAS
ncbi:MAG: YbjN domain-containing protein [Actinomycetota bacterium]|nr:YbjN domain-containing protein [Actinomycetota bacterium]